MGQVPRKCMRKFQGTSIARLYLDGAKRECGWILLEEEAELAVKNVYIFEDAAMITKSV